MVDTGMDTGTGMGRNNITHHQPCPARSTRHAVRLALFGILSAVWTGNALAEPAWVFQPRLSVSEVYTDNVDLAPSGEEDSDLITVIAPGFSLLRESARLKLNVNYRLRALSFVEDEDANRIDHHLNGEMNAELHEELLFLDASARMSQAIVDARAPQSLDGISGGQNLADVQAYTLSPYLQHNFSNYFNGLLRYGHERVYADRAIQDAETNSVRAGIDSGPNFGLLDWNLDFFKSREERGTSDTLDRETASARVSYRLHPKFSLLGEWGREDNDFSTTEVPVNGSYWAAGATWSPNRYLSLTAMEGDRFKSASVQLTPTVRTSLSVSYREREVGLNPGSVWSGDFQHRTRRTVWRLNYFEDTQTTQRALLDALALNDAIMDAIGAGDFVLDENGNPVLSVDPSGFFTLRDEIFERKRGQGSVSYQTGKSTFAIVAFAEQRNYLESDVLGSAVGMERIRGGSAHWRWQFSGRSHTNISGNWRRTEFGSDGREDDLWYIDTLLTRALSSNASASVGYRFTRNDSSQAASEYTENRLLARFNIEF
jgi:uncharacterized protein (PEP-CTERM system associated)